MGIRFAGRLFLTLLLASPLTLLAQEKEEPKEEGFKFTDVISLPCTPVKDQNRAGTCWSYSGLGFFESELLRMGKGEVDLSEQFIVRNAYHDKAVSYVRYHGTVEFAGGGSFKDVINVLKRDGIVPESVYTGLQYGEENHVHGELDALTRAYVDAVIKNKNRRLSTAWLKGFDGILDAYLGPLPTKFKEGGKEYTPKSYMESLGLNLDDYAFITSFTHHPFYKPFIIEIPDNWARGEDMNVPLDEMMAIIDYSLEHGYPVGWGSDVSEQGFKYNNGVAVIPVKPTAELADSEKLKWSTMTKEERQKMVRDIKSPVPEQQITQEMRQKAFDNWETTDDHGMVIMGIAKDQNGTKYYKVKNSWTADGVYGGYFYASESFVRYKTMDIMVNKNGIPAAIAKKMGLK